MLRNVTEVISGLEQQKLAIDEPIAVLREFEGDGVAEPPRSTTTVTGNPAKKKRVMSEEGRKRIGDATRKHWAAVHKAAKKAAKKAA